MVTILKRGKSVLKPKKKKNRKMVFFWCGGECGMRDFFFFCYMWNEGFEGKHREKVYYSKDESGGSAFAEFGDKLL